MDRGFRVYMKEGLKQAKKTFKGRKSSKFKYLFMLVASLLSILLLIPMPLFVHSKIRLAKQATEKNVYDISHSFEDANSPKCYWSTMVAMLFKIVIILSAFILVGAIGFALFYVGTLFANITGIQALRILFTIPAIIALVVVIIGLSLYFTPVNYYLNKDSEIGIAKALGASTRTMKEQGKKTLFLINLFFYIILSLYVGITGFIFLYLARNESESIKIIANLALIIFVVIFVLFIPKFGLAKDIATLALMNDIMINPDEADDLTLVKEKMLKQGLSKDEFLVSLFDKKLENEEGQEEKAEEAKEENTEAKEENKNEEEKK